MNVYSWAMSHTCFSSVLTVGGFFFSLQGPLERSNEVGIMFRHAYSLTAVEKVNVPEQNFLSAWSHWYFWMPLKAWLKLVENNHKLTICRCCSHLSVWLSPPSSARWRPHMALSIWCGSWTPGATQSGRGPGVIWKGWNTYLITTLTRC